MAEAGPSASIVREDHNDWHLPDERPAKRPRQQHIWATPSTPKTTAAQLRAATAEARRSSQMNPSSCAQEIAIEDLAHLHCGITGASDKHTKSSHKSTRARTSPRAICSSRRRPKPNEPLLQAPVVPSQSESAFPLPLSSSYRAHLAVEAGGKAKSQQRKHSKRSSNSIRALQAAPPSSSSTQHPYPYRHRGPSTLQQTHQAEAQGCLLESRNPDYFRQPRYSKWHSSTEQAQATSGMMLIDPESAVDYTSIFARPHLPSLGGAAGEMGVVDDKYTTFMESPMTEASWFTAPLLVDNEDHLSGIEDYSSASEASSLQSSPDALQQPLPYDALDAPALRGPGFDVDTMFDWDQADALLVDAGFPAMSTLAFERSMASQFSELGGSSTLMATSLQATSAQQQMRQQRAQADGPPPPTFSPAQSSLDFSRENSVDPEAGIEVQQETESTSLPKPKKQRSIHGSDDEPLTHCYNCGVTKTPLWRRTPDKRHSLCNACGLYLKQYKHDRPLNRVQRQLATKAEEDKTPTVCANCGGTHTSLWRKDEHGATVCNACGLYNKLHGKVRPVGMRKEKVSRRKRFRNLPPSPPAVNATAVAVAATAAAAAAVVGASVPITVAADKLAAVKHESDSPHSTPSALSTPVAA